MVNDIFKSKNGILRLTFDKTEYEKVNIIILIIIFGMDVSICN